MLVNKESKGNSITRADCWAHLRRMIIEAEKAVPEIARHALEQIGALHGVEPQAAKLFASSGGMRQEKSAPMLLQLRENSLAWKEQLLPKPAPHGQSDRLCAQSKAGVERVLLRRRRNLDNNASERQIKRVLLNRKNLLFVGNPRGVRTSGILASIAGTCRGH